MATQLEKTRARQAKQREANARWRAKNREHIAAYFKKWRVNRKEGSK